MTTRFELTTDSVDEDLCTELHRVRDRAQKMRETAPTAGYRGDKLRDFIRLTTREEVLREQLTKRMIVRRCDKYRAELTKLVELGDSPTSWIGVTDEGLQPQDINSLARTVYMIDRDQHKIRQQGDSPDKMIAENLDGYAVSLDTEELIDDMRRRLILKGHVELVDKSRDKDWLREKQTEAREFYNTLRGLLPETQPQPEPGAGFPSHMV